MESRGESWHMASRWGNLALLMAALLALGAQPARYFRYQIGTVKRDLPRARARIEKGHFYVFSEEGSDAAGPSGYLLSEPVTLPLKVGQKLALARSTGQAYQQVLIPDDGRTRFPIDEGQIELTRLSESFVEGTFQGRGRLNGKAPIPFQGSFAAPLDTSP